MNKLYILCALGMGLAFTSCDEVEDSLAKPQTNPQEAPFDASVIAVTPDASLLNLIELNAQNKPAQLAVATLGDTEGYTLRLAAQLAKTEDFAEPVAIETENGADGVVSVSADELQNFYYDKVTHDPREGKAYVRFAAYAAKGSSEVRIGGPDFYYGPYELSIKPFDAEKVIEDSYTLKVGDQEIPFGHTDVSPYDDPVFSVVAQATDGAEWQVVSATGTVYGPAGATDATGDLLADAPAGKFGINGPVMFSINMLTDTYEYKLAYECMYTPGGSNGWSAPASQILTTDNYDYYSGVVVIDEAGFKMNPDNDWKGHDMGVGEALTETAPGVYEGSLNGGGNITAGAKGLYYVEFTLSTRAIKISAINTLGAIGGFNGWAASEPMLPSDDFLVWTSAPLDFPAGCEWKIRANDGWTINWGDSLDALKFNAGNITTKDAGKYVVTVDFSAVPYVATLTEQ